MPLSRCRPSACLAGRFASPNLLAMALWTADAARVSWPWHFEALTQRKEIVRGLGSNWWAIIGSVGDLVTGLAEAGVRQGDLVGLVAGADGAVTVAVIRGSSGLPS